MSTITVDRSDQAAPVERSAPHLEAADQAQHEPTWQTVVWDDPVNLMSYVSFVFRRHFGFDDDRAEQLMLQVHHSGSAVVAEGARGAMEMHVEALHEYGLWATVQPGGQP